MEAGLRRRGPWTADELKRSRATRSPTTFGQDPEHVLMGHFERHLSELGQRIDGSFLAFAQQGSVEALATELAGWDTWYDRSPYHGDEIPFFKRAQIAAADLALPGLADPTGLDR